MEIWLRKLIPRFKLYKYPSIVIAYEFYASLRYRSLFESIITFRGAVFKIGRDVTLFPSVYLGSYEKEELDLLLNEEFHEGDVMWDIGANIGLYSVLFCSKFPKAHVICFEPNMDLHDLLIENFKINQLSNYRIEGVALSNFNGFATLEHSARRAGAGKIAIGKAAGNTLGKIAVSTGDTFLALNKNCAPRFIKIDVEGHEPEVIDGLRETLSTHRPILSIEVFKKLWGINRHETWNATIVSLFDIYANGLLVSDGKVTKIHGWKSEYLTGGMQTLVFGLDLNKH